MLNVTKVKRWTNTKAKLNMKHFIPIMSSCPVPWLSVGDVWHKVAIVDQWLLPAPARSPCLCLTSQLETWRCHESRVTCSRPRDRADRAAPTHGSKHEICSHGDLCRLHFMRLVWTLPSLSLSCLYKCAILHFVINWLSLRKWKLHVQYSACRRQQ